VVSLDPLRLSCLESLECRDSGTCCVCGVEVGTRLNYLRWITNARSSGKLVEVCHGVLFGPFGFDCMSDYWWYGRVCSEGCRVVLFDRVDSLSESILSVLGNSVH
jgi:hypothetical protein